MPGSTRPARILVCAAVTAVTAAACGGSGSGGSPTSSPTPVDVKAASGINLRLSDFPSGWRAGHGAPGVTRDRQILACAVGAATPSGVTADVNSAAFGRAPSSASALVATSSVTLKSSATAASKDFRVISGPHAAGCLSRILAAALKPNLPSTAHNIRVTVTRERAPGGNSSVAFRVTVTATVSGQRLTTGRGTQVFFQRGRAIAGINAIAVGKASFPTTLLRQLISKVYARAGAVAGG